MRDAQASGLDLRGGVAQSDIPEGRLICGSFYGQRVLLAHHRGRYCAVSATCTHLGGPLGEGILVDGRVHCPWHHARFSVETGEAVAAPAFEPLTRFGTLVRDGRVFVTEPIERAATSVATAPAQRVAILGAGAGGYACAELLERYGYGGSVTLISDDEDSPYDRTFCSKQYLAGRRSRDDSKLATLRGRRTGGSEEGFRLVRGHARSLDTKNSSLELDSGEWIAFDRLVIATGAEPKRPRFPGSDRPNVYSLRTLRDADALIEAAARSKTVAIAGASFIALEAAAALRQRKLEVHVVAPEDVPFETLLGPEIGHLIWRVHEQKGVHFHLGREIRSFDGKLLELDGGLLEADFLVLGVGVTPRSGLAQEAGLRCAPMERGGGIEVNERLETSVSGIFAIGDVARYPDPLTGEMIRVEHWVHAERQGQHVARVIMGQAQRYRDVPFFWTAHFDTSLRYVGHVGSIVQRRIDGSIDARNFSVCYSGEDGEKSALTCRRDVRALLLERDWESANRR